MYGSKRIFCSFSFIGGLPHKFDFSHLFSVEIHTCLLVKLHLYHLVLLITWDTTSPRPLLPADSLCQHVTDFIDWEVYVISYTGKYFQ